MFGGLGDLAGAFSSGGADDAANSYYRDLIEKMKGVNPTITAEQAAPSNQMDQTDALRQLQGIYRGGGLDAISRGQMAEAQAGANRNASANREGVVENAAAGGMRNSGVTGALQEMGGQQAMGDANLAASRAAGTAESNRMGAIGGAAEIGARTAAAQDTINRFNASMRQGAQQQTFSNKMGQLSTEGDTYGNAWNAGRAGEARTSRLYGSAGKMIGGAEDSGNLPSWLQL